jgi:general secretion pathway protein E
MSTMNMSTTHAMLGEILVQSGKLSAEELNRALQLQEKKPDRLGRLLLNLGALSERDLLYALSQQFHLPVIESSQFPPLPPELKTISPRFMHTGRFFPFYRRDGELLIVIADPLDHETLESIRLVTGCRLIVHLASETEITDAIEKYYGAGTSSFGRLVESFEQAEKGGEIAESEDAEHLRDLALEAPVIRVVNLLMSRAVESRASDIHIEPMENELRIRIRIDGILYPTEAPPRQMSAAVISRVKLMAKLNIAERRLPQDGRIRLKVLGKDVDLRVSTLPTIFGESVVMRILDRSDTRLLSLELLGYPPQMLERMRAITAHPHGIFLVTGPTGSGKSTTLYASLGQINQTDKKIVTLEDPIEYQIAGVNQVHVNPLIGLTFAAGLRHIVRQDPDVIMVGEIRDLETAEIAIRAALTGHLVFSTLHTNDAPSAITRLIDMGVPSYLLSSSIIAVLAQRLVRVLCPECKRPVNVDSSIFADGKGASHAEPRSIQVFQPTGCPACREIGFRQRVGIFELMEINEDLQHVIARSGEANVLREAARRNGMKTLREDGWEKVLGGVTAVEEVLRVTQETV